jgi:hypothetical protein
MWFGRRALERRVRRTNAGEWRIVVAETAGQYHAAYVANYCGETDDAP